LEPGQRLRQRRRRQGDARARPRDPLSGPAARDHDDAQTEEETMTAYAPDPSLTLHDARDEYFRVNDFGPNGGYDDAWVDFKLGPIPMPFPNSPGRKKAVRFHDLHHALTGYATDTIGEFEISAWEVGSGCAGYLAAWQLNLAGMT